MHGPSASVKEVVIDQLVIHTHIHTHTRIQTQPER